MKDYETTVKHCDSIEDIIEQIGLTANKLLPKCETEEEKAFLLGHINLAAAIVAGIDNGRISLSFDYTLVKDMYKRAQKKQTEKVHQISIDEFLSDLLTKLDKLDKPSKKSSKKSKKE